MPNRGVRGAADLDAGFATTTSGWCACPRACTYTPIGIPLLFFFHAPPAAAIIDTALLVGVVSTAMALVGFLTRPALALSFLSSWFLASLSYSFAGSFSHEYNGILLVQLALLFAPCGRALSVDALFFRGRLAKQPSALACNVPVFAAQFMIGWMFFNAFCYKTLVGGSLWWRSDNLRNVLALQWIALSRAAPAWILFIGNHAAVYHLMALGSMIAQGSMLLSLLYFKRPYRRAVFGAGFVAETLGLGFMMGRWDISPLNPHWLVMYAVFIDWNYFIANRDSAVEPGGREIGEERARRWSDFAAIWAGAIVVTEFVASFATLGRLVPAAYPFTPYPMYSRLFGKVVLPGHVSYQFLGPRFVSPDADVALGSPAARIAYSGNFYINENDKIDDVEGRMLQAQRRMRLAGVTPANQPSPALTLYESIYSVGAYPAPNVPAVMLEGIRAAVGRDGSFIGASSPRLGDGGGGGATLDITTRNIDLSSDASVLAIPVDFRGIERWGRVTSKSIYDVGTPIELHGQWTGSRFHTTDLAHGSYLIALRAAPSPGFASANLSAAVTGGRTLFLTGPIVEW